MNYVYVVFGEVCYGESGGASEWDICAYVDKEKVEILVDLLNDRHAEIWAQYELDMEAYNKAYSVAMNKVRNHGADRSILPQEPEAGNNQYDTELEPTSRWNRVRDRETVYSFKAVELRE